jgi:hypothetical protein
MSGSDDSWDEYVIGVPERSALQYLAICFHQDLLLQLPTHPMRVSDVQVPECVEYLRTYLVSMNRAELKDQLGEFLATNEGATAEQLKVKWRELGAEAHPPQLREILEAFYALLDR